MPDWSVQLFCHHLYGDRYATSNFTHPHAYEKISVVINILCVREYCSSITGKEKVHCFVTRWKKNVKCWTSFLRLYFINLISYTWTWNSSVIIQIRRSIYCFLLTIYFCLSHAHYKCWMLKYNLDKNKIKILISKKYSFQSIEKRNWDLLSREHE